MPLCRVCGVSVPKQRRYCDLHRRQQRLAAKADVHARKMALKPRFRALGLRFDSNRSFKWLYRQLGERPPPERQKAMRVAAIPKPPRRQRFRGVRACANPVCGEEFMPKRKDQIYCYGGDVDCRSQMARINREVARRVKFATDVLPGQLAVGPKAVVNEAAIFKQVVAELKERRAGIRFRHV